jgi:two-component system, sensor histidine kinase LadS
MLLLSTACAEETGKINVTQRFGFLRDTTHSLPFSTVQKAEAWHAFAQPAMAFNFTNDVIWLRGKTDDPCFAAGRVLTLPWKVFDSAILFYPDASGNYIEYKTGDTVPKRLWALPEALDPSFRMPVVAARGNPYFYIRLQSVSLISFPLYSLSEARFLRELVLESAVNWLILALCVVMVLIALFQFWVFRIYEFLLYAGYVVCQTMWINNNHGNAFHFFWPDSIWWQSRSNLFFVALAIPFSFQFARGFLATRKHTPFIDKVFNVFSVVSAVCAVAVLFTSTNRIFSNINSLIYLVSIPLFFASGIMAYRRGNRRVVFFILSWGIYFAAGYPFAAYLAGIIPYSEIVVYGLVFAFPVDLLFLLFNLFQKYRDLAEESAAAMRGRLHLSQKSAGKYTKSKLDTVDVPAKLHSLETWMRSAKPWQNEDFDLQTAADALALSRQQLSELVNVHKGLSFRYYINSFRIDEAKTLLARDANRTVLDIAFATGFGSKNAFNSEFKRITGETPQEFRRKNAANPS